MGRRTVGSPTLFAAIDAPPSRTSPVTCASVKHGTSRARQRASVDLPAPVAPITSVTVRGGSASVTRSSAGAVAPG